MSRLGQVVNATAPPAPFMQLAHLRTEARAVDLATEVKALRATESSPRETITSGVSVDFVGLPPRASGEGVPLAGVLEALSKVGGGGGGRVKIHLWVTLRAVWLKQFWLTELLHRGMPKMVGIPQACFFCDILRSIA